MRTLLPYLIGSVAGLVYGSLSVAVSGNWNVVCMFAVGAVVAIVAGGLKRKDEPLPSATKAAAKKPLVSMASRPSAVAAPETALAPDAASVSVAGTVAAVPTVQTVASAISVETPERLWKQAQELDPGPDADLPPDRYERFMESLLGAAEGGIVPALARAGELAYRRGVMVEAYFWTKLAYRRQELADPSDTDTLHEIDAMRRIIARSWKMAGQPLEIENVNEHFPEERGELGRAFLRIDSGLEVKPTQEFIRFLAEKGNPDAALFDRCGMKA